MRIVSAVMLLLLAGAAAGESQVTNGEFGYRLMPPDGFTDYPEGRAQKDVVDCWVEATPVSQNGSIVLCVQRLHGTLGRKGMRQEDLPSSIQLVRFQWKGFNIDGVRSDTVQAGIPVIVLVSQVPLRREAVQLIVTGPRDQDARLQAIMPSTLATLEGETNWLSRAERDERLGNIVGLVIGVAVALIGIRIWRTRRRSKTA